jgi:hypothetical protein
MHRDNVGARHHDIIDPALAQRQDILQHGTFRRRNAGFTGQRGFEHDFDVGAGRSGLPAEKRARESGEESLPVGRGSGHRQHRHG